eukprot:TRINITY_DN20910_c0_g1_i1.p1 TRINITY_DN20910_c0_g1~~TRINITY_DN20910_c0_g1_i1.p1  ORF type:complete len:346 (+),score=33.07 TRINITY_DN20910_c0_g1_i1:118-1155(+)
MSGIHVCTSALLDIFTSLSTVAYWAGIWSCLNAFNVSELISGVIATLLVFILAVAGVDHSLHETAKNWPTVLEPVLVWCWTCCLALLSILIWRAGWKFLETYYFNGEDLSAGTKLVLLGSAEQVHPSSIKHGIGLAFLGAAMLVATGRYRSASHAPPIGVVTDLPADGRSRFAPAAFSGSSVKSVLIDFVLTVPVVLVWHGVWTASDNLNIDPLISAIACTATVAVWAVCDVDEFLRRAFAGTSVMVHHVADVVFTTVLVFLVVGVWRGTWETLDHHIDLVNNPRISAAMAFSGALGLTVMRRHRSAVFPPIDFSIDDGDHFASVGHTQPKSLLADTPGMYSTEA